MTSRPGRSAMAHLGSVLAEGLPPTGRDSEWDFCAGRPAHLRWCGEELVVVNGLEATFGQATGSAAAGIDDIVTEIGRVRGHPAGEALLRDSPYALAQLAQAGLPWTATVRLVEALTVITEDDARLGVTAARHNLPLVHRARFLILSAAWRLDEGPPDELALGEAFGDHGSEVAYRARVAREHWLVDLVNHEEHPALTRWDECRLDHELRRLLLADPDLRPAGAGVALQLETADNPDDDHIRLAAWVAREWFLPRFMLVDCWRTLRLDHKRSVLAVALAYVLLGLVTLTTLLGVVIAMPRTLLVQASIGVSLVAYAIVVGAIGHRREAGFLACLRLPASAAVGSLALISLDSHWVATPGGRWRWAAALLLLASYGYLVVEAASHGAGVAAWLRALLVAVLGFVHAVAVAVLFTEVVAPALDITLGSTVRTLGAAGLSRLYLLAGSTGLAAGVFLQVLWDDRPVTYPLTHLRWRGRGRP